VKSGKLIEIPEATKNLKLKIKSQFFSKVLVQRTEFTKKR
jgi:hypothetical protein